MDILGEIKNLAEQHPDEARQVVDQAENLLDGQTGNRFSSEIQRGGSMLEGQLGLSQQAEAPAAEAPAAEAPASDAQAN